MKARRSQVMTRTKRLRKLREEFKRLYVSTASDRGERVKRLMESAQRELRLDEREQITLLDYLDELNGIGPDTYKQMLGEERYAKVMAGYDREWRERHGGSALGGRTDMTMSKEAMEMLDKDVKEMDDGTA
jgi:hypothetical protein